MARFCSTTRPGITASALVVVPQAPGNTLRSPGERVVEHGAGLILGGPIQLVGDPKIEKREELSFIGAAGANPHLPPSIARR